MKESFARATWAFVEGRLGLCRKTIQKMAYQHLREAHPNANKRQIEKLMCGDGIPFSVGEHRIYVVRRGSTSRRGPNFKVFYQL